MKKIIQYLNPAMRETRETEANLTSITTKVTMGHQTDLLQYSSPVSFETILTGRRLRKISLLFPKFSQLQSLISIKKANPPSIILKAIPTLTNK
jgi:hypothetical protein